MKLQYKLLNYVSLFSIYLITHIVSADDLSDYVRQCKSELDFDTFIRFDCQRDQFRFGDHSDLKTYVNYGDFRERNFSASDDYVSHRAINAEVDAVFACRWVSPGNKFSIDGTGTAISGEMIVHNRRNGKTCYFQMSLKETSGGQPNDRVLTTNPLPPDDPQASNFWEQPSNFAMKTCTECHSAGPYIASNEIVGALAKFGLMNDGHDIQGKLYSAVTPPNNSRFKEIAAAIKTTIQPLTVQKMDSQKNKSTIINPLNTCTAGCHLVGGYFTDKDGVPTPLKNDGFEEGPAFEGLIVIPSINLVIDDMVYAKYMPPKNSDYFSVNRDTPSATGDHEFLSEVKKDFPNLGLCDNPTSIEAHTVDSSIILKADSDGFVTSKKLYKFNVYDGLVCKDSDNPAVHYGGCWNWQTRYKCGDDWTDWLDGDSDNSDGMQNETRSNYEKAYKALHTNDGKTFCSNPTHIQARYFSLGGTSNAIYGPRDRLRQFDNKGLRCYNEDQPNKQCHNYVVKFICP